MIEKVILGFEAEWWMPDACLAMRKKPQNGQPEADGREVLKKFKEDSQDASNGPGLTGKSVLPGDLSTDSTDRKELKKTYIAACRAEVTTDTDFRHVRNDR